MRSASDSPAMGMNGTTAVQDASVNAKGNIQNENSTHFNNWPNSAGFNACDEQRQRQQLEVQGEFPSWAAGSLLRTGPGRSKVNTDKGKEFTISHWFDGFTHVHKFDIVANASRSPEVYYTSRTQVDDLVENVRKTGKLDGFSFGQKRDPCDSLFRKFKTTFESPKLDPMHPLTANVGVAFQQTVASPAITQAKENTKGRVSGEGMLSVTTDAHMTKEFDLATLEPLGVTQQQHLHPSLKGHLSGAHPARDAFTGDIFNYNLEFGPKITYRLFKTNAMTGNTEILATISGADIKPAYIHSMFLTENYVILCIWPAIFKSYGAMILWTRNLLDAMKFEPSVSSTWLVVDRRHGKGLVAKYSSPPMFCFHSTNAWEERREDGKIDIVTEVFTYPNTDILHRFYLDNLISDSPGAPKWAGSNGLVSKGSLERFKLADITGGHGIGKKAVKIAENILSIGNAKAGDLQLINPHYATKPHQYVYSVCDRGLSSLFDSLVKTDIEAKDCVYWSQDKHSPGEPIFIPNPNGTAEDDGVLLSVVLDGTAGTSYLLCLDARTMKEVGRANCKIPIGFGFHGIHLPSHS